MDTKKAAAWFIIIIMVLSIGGFIGGSLLAPANSNPSLEQEFNGYKFQRENNLWTININGQKYGFLYLPQELQALTLPLSAASWKSVEKVYFVDETSALTMPSIDSVNSANPAGSAKQSLFASSLPLLQAVFYLNNVRLQEACLSEAECAKDVPITDCEKPALIIRSPEKNNLETTLNSDRQCLIIQASSLPEMEKVTERIIYEFLGVLS